MTAPLPTLCSCGVSFPDVRLLRARQYATCHPEVSMSKSSRPTPKAIGLKVSDVPGVGLVVDVTFPFPITGTPTTRRVAISDEAAERLITDTQAVLQAHRARDGRKELPR